MRTLTLALLALFLPAAAMAGTANVSWTNPTQFEDGTALAPADIASTTVEYGSCTGTAFGTKAGQQVATGSASTLVISNLAPATYCFRAATTVVAAKGGGTSTFSNVASKVVPFSNPKPPTLLDVIIAWLRRVFGHFA
jgi:hypothetical protein